MDVQRIADSLHLLERKVLPLISRSHNFAEIVRQSGLSEVEVMRAVQWLSNKKLLTITESTQRVVVLGENGQAYARDGLPERRMLTLLEGGPVRLADFSQHLARDEVQASLGILRRKNAVEISKQGDDVMVQLSGFGKKLLTHDSFEDKFLRRGFPIPVSNLSSSDALLLEEFRKRKDVVRVEDITMRSVALTDEGRAVLAHGIHDNAIDTLTPAAITSGAWRTQPMRRYDVVAPVPRTYAGRKQHYRRFLDSVRRKFMSLGFVEMSGPIVETDFWDMDALYMPQFHSARDIHDAYYVREPKYAASLPTDLVQRVKEAHENGLGTGSRGWRYPFDVRRTYRHLLRTQGTACSARMLASPNLTVPGKYFAIARCFRYDVVDATHLADFFQTEGIVIEKGLTLRHLIGLLKMFAKEFAGADEIKVTPSYFPFTEPSASLYAKHPQMGWIELGGSGIFRPEMTKALGIDVPVIAWGIGIDRIAMFKLGLTDIRELFSHNLKTLRDKEAI